MVLGEVQLRALISGVARFMNKSSKSVKEDEHKAMKKSKQIAAVKDEEILLEANSYIVDEISDKDFDSFQNVAPVKHEEEAEHAKAE